MRLLPAALVLALARTAEAREPAEPMQTDLVRGLGPHAGELEANVLATTPIAGREHGVHWAPEIEWAPARNVAIELELPLHDAHLEAVKLSAQLTLHRGRRIAHGMQGVASLPLVADPSFRLLHVMQASLGRRASVVTMLGPKLAVPTSDRAPHFGVLAMAAVFAELPRRNAIGIEASWSGYGREGQLDVLPQLHVELGRHAKLQLGVGARRSTALGWGAFVGARVIVQR
ncbi:MAG TPA: hypothetical protein VG755_16720 [Nannocystaceae bacterium]|nr:hypothetical protein [Nannocystaceae bacterium]